MTSWTAVWGPDRVRLFWELTVTDEHRTVAMRQRSHATVIGPFPDDRLLVSIGLCPAGDWKRNEENGSWSCPVIVTKQSREDELSQGLLARGRSLPGARDH